LALSAAFIQWRSGAYSADLAAYPDEPAHVVSGLMVHDYVVRLLRLAEPAFPAGPRAFAEAYYVHYPKVAIGHWPPLFYIVQAAWMFAFGRTKTALLLLMLTVVAATAILVRDLARHFSGSEWAGLSAAAIFLLLPVTQQSLYAVMPDAVLALLAAAAIAVAAHPRWSPQWLWVIAIAAVMVHFRGAPLLLLFFIAVVASVYLKTLRLRFPWMALLIMFLLVGVPLLLVRQTARLHVGNVANAAVMFPVHLLRTLGPVPFVMTVLGAWVVPYRKQQGWFGITGLVLGIWLFFSVAIVPWENRYLMIGLPACILLTAGAWQWMAARLRAITRLPGGWILGALAVGTALLCLRRPVIVRKPNANYEAAVRQVLDGPDGLETVYLVAGNSLCEGAFIAGVDLADRPGRHIVLRSSKTLANSDWSGRYFVPLFQSPEAIAAFLEGSHISLVVIDDTARSDVEMLHAALRQTPSWVELPSSSRASLYRRTTPLPPGPIKIRLDMRQSLKRDLEWTQ
jgi:hypothetical protein